MKGNRRLVSNPVMQPLIYCYLPQILAGSRQSSFHLPAVSLSFRKHEVSAFYVLDARGEHQESVPA